MKFALNNKRYILKAAINLYSIAFNVRPFFSGEIDQIEKNLLQIKDHLVVISNEIKAREPLEDRSENKQNLEK